MYDQRIDLHTVTEPHERTISPRSTSHEILMVHLHSAAHADGVTVDLSTWPYSRSRLSD